MQVWTGMNSIPLTGYNRMCTTCNEVSHMSTVMIQVRNVPQRIHRTLKARASLAGKA